MGVCKWLFFDMVQSSSSMARATMNVKKRSSRFAESTQLSLFLDLIKMVNYYPCSTTFDLCSAQSLLIRPKMTQWYRQEDNHVVVRVLDTDNIKVISSVLGQSVALDNYSK